MVNTIDATWIVTVQERLHVDSNKRLACLLTSLRRIHFLLNLAGGRGPAPALATHKMER